MAAADDGEPLPDRTAAEPPDVSENDSVAVDGR
jgi:hypothetical protein